MFIIVHTGVHLPCVYNILNRWKYITFLGTKYVWVNVIRQREMLTDELRVLLKLKYLLKT